MDGAPGKTSWVAVSSRATMEAALRAADGGTPLTLPLESAGGDNAKAAEMLAAAVAILSQGKGMDEAKVREVARDEASKFAAPHTHVLTGGDREPVDVGTTHKIYSRVLDMLADGLCPYLVGPPACGKTHLGQQLAKALAKHFGHDPDSGYILHADSWNADMMDWRVSGTVNPLSGAFNPTPFYHSVTVPGLYLMDEPDKMSQTVTGCFNLAMDNPKASFACGLVLKHKHARMFAAGNTPGLGATLQYPDRNVLPADFRDRWTFVNMDYDEALERKITLAVNPDAGEWVDYVQEVRARIAKAGTPILATPRASVQGAKLLLRKWSRKDIENAVLWKNAPDSMVARAKGDA
jgi:MoxR-like ATPase